jgi:hypothetical protein
MIGLGFVVDGLGCSALAPNGHARKNLTVSGLSGLKASIRKPRAK